MRLEGDGPASPRGSRGGYLPKVGGGAVCMREEEELDSRKREERPRYLLGVGSKLRANCKQSS